MSCVEEIFAEAAAVIFRLTQTKLRNDDGPSKDEA